MMDTLDGDYQAMKANDGAYVRKHFFGRDPRTWKWSPRCLTKKSLTSPWRP
jgi:pyruvate dehydrogenase complex dehydrogenase (E1) component